MSDRSPRLPFAATLVLRGSTVLTLAEKIVWLEDHAFDRGPEGAYVSASSVAARWGGSLAPRTIENARTRLKLLGLHERIARPGARNAFGWVSTLPHACIPHGIRPTQAEVDRLVLILDDAIRRVGAPLLEGAPSPRSEGDRPPSGRGTDPLRERGTPASNLKHLGASLLHPQGKEEVGAGSLEPEGDVREPTRVERRAMAEQDARERDATEAEGWERLRQRREARRRAAGLE